MARLPKKNSKITIDFSAMFYLSAVIIIVFLIYSFSLTRTWLPFDESLIHKEELLPIPASFNELFEVINSFVFNCHMVSMNSFFSNIVTLRSAPLVWSVLSCILFFFKKNATLYHLFQLLIHLTNCILVFYIFKKSRDIIQEKKPLSNSGYLIISLFTLIWALHCTSTEAVLLTTNWNALLTYTFCFCFILYEILDIQERRYRIIPLRNSIASILFFLLMCFTEYAYTLPIIIFFIILSLNLKNMDNSKEAFVFSLKKILTYISALFFYFLFSLANQSSTLNNLISVNFNSSTIYSFLERNFWLSPQIFINFLKLLFFPKTLSTYQSDLIYLADSLFSRFSIIAIVFYLGFLLAPIICFLIFKSSKLKHTSLLLYAFFFSCFPFLHIISPTYCLMADRYCYFPLFTLLLFVLTFVFYTKQVKSKILLFCLLCILIILTSRTLIRIQDWSNPINFYNSVIKAESKPLYKGHKFLLLADFFNSQNMKSQTENTVQQSLNELNKSLVDLKTLKEKTPNQPITLKYYGLDYNSLLLKSVYCIAIIKKNYLNASAENILKFYEPFISERLNDSAPNEIAFYGSLLLSTNAVDKAKSIYERAYKRFPFILEISLPLADIYLTYDKNTDKAFQILQQSYRYYPNKGMPMYKLLKYYEVIGSPINEAKFAYLLGLREHSIESYQHAAQIYLDLDKSQNAKKAIDKLLQLNPNNPLTLVQLARYLDMTANRKNIPEILNRAYLLNKASNTNKPYITKAILVGLININYRLGNVENTKKYLSELETIQDLSQKDIQQIQSVKEGLTSTN